MEKRYELRTVKDFYDVPAEKRAACLEDFASWLLMMEGFHELLGDIEGVRSDRDVFRWIDDGKHDMNVSIGVINTRGAAPVADCAVDPVVQTAQEGPTRDPESSSDSTRVPPQETPP